MKKTEEMGTKPISKLLISQGLPSAIGILMLSVNGVVDSIFLGNFIGDMAIGAVQVVTSITFFISAIGMAVGVGGASVISRAFGSGDNEKAYLAFGNQTLLVFSVAFTTIIVGVFFQDALLTLFGAKGGLLAPSQVYFSWILPTVPFLAWAMMSNNVLRAEGAPQIAMVTMLIPVFINLILDPILIIYFDMGMKGAAIATATSYFFSAAFTFWYFFSGRSQLSFDPKYLTPDIPMMKEITSIGTVTFARQASVSLLAIILNNSLFRYGGEFAVSSYGIVSRILMFSFPPVFGVVQGFLPIAGFNYGALKYDRVRLSISKSIKYGTSISMFVFVLVMAFAPSIVSVFSKDAQMIKDSAFALRWVFAGTPLITIQLIASAYYQATGRPKPALLLTVQKQLFFLIPLVFILSSYFGLKGIWYSFAVSDVLTALVCIVFIRKSMAELDEKQLVLKKR